MFSLDLWIAASVKDIIIIACSGAGVIKALRLRRQLASPQNAVLRGADQVLHLLVLERTWWKIVDMLIQQILAGKNGALIVVNFKLLSLDQRSVQSPGTCLTEQSGEVFDWPILALRAWRLPIVRLWTQWSDGLVVHIDHVWLCPSMFGLVTAILWPWVNLIFQMNVRVVQIVLL